LAQRASGAIFALNKVAAPATLSEVYEFHSPQIAISVDVIFLRP
jgi:hypothetical protein